MYNYDRAASDDVRSIKGPAWDIAGAAKEMTRFEFIAHFVARQTRTKVLRKLGDGYQLVKKGDVWTYLYPSGLPVSQSTRDVHKLYEELRRGPLGFLVRQAEDFRVDVLTPP